MHDVIALRVSRNEIRFYMERRELLSYKRRPRATFEGGAALLGLHKGDVLLFEEVLGAESGLRPDADKTHRHVVRLAEEPTERTDPLTNTKVLDVRTTRMPCHFRCACVNSRTERVRRWRGATSRSQTMDRRSSASAGDDLVPSESASALTGRY